MLPYDADALQALLGLYNRALWPAQLVSLAACALTLWLVWRRRGGRLVAMLLVVAWLWTGMVYQFGYYASLNWAGWLYGPLFAAQALALAWFGVVRRWRLAPPDDDHVAHAGLALAMFVSLAYPLLEMATGTGPQSVQMVGLVPDATVVFTLGVLLAVGGAPRLLLVLPAAWCGWSALWSWQLAMPVQMLPPLLALSALLWAVWKRRSGG